MQGPATCSAARRAVAAGSGRGREAGAAYPELPSHVSNTAALMSHSCKDNDRIGERSEQDGTTTQHNTVPRIGQVAAPRRSSSSLGPGLHRRDRTTQPENTERKGTGWGVAQSRGSSPEAGAVGGVLPRPTWGPPILSLSASCGPLSPKSLILSQEVSRRASSITTTLGPSWGGPGSWQADVLGGAAPLDNSG